MKTWNHHISKRVYLIKIQEIKKGVKCNLCGSHGIVAIIAKDVYEFFSQ